MPTRTIGASPPPCALALAAMLAAMACTPSTAGFGTSVGGEPVSTSEASTDTASAGSTSAGSASSVGPVSATSASSLDGTTTVDVTTTTTAATSDDGSSSSDTSSGSSDTSSTSGGDPLPTYPPCADADPRCPAPYDDCIEPMGGMVGNACTLGCNDASECPLPDSGGATVVCTAPMMMDDFCQLDCSRGPCPDGMACVGLGPMGQAMRCLWPPP